MCRRCVRVSRAVWTFHRTYETHSQLLLAPMVLLGAYIIFYSVIGQNPGYGPLGVYLVYLFR